MFESMGGGAAEHPGGAPSRFHLTLTAAGRPVMHGWWPERAVAEGKFTTWIGAYGAMAAARVVLVDEHTHRVLASWPDDTVRLPD